MSNAVSLSCIKIPKPIPQEISRKKQAEMGARNKMHVIPIENKTFLTNHLVVNSR